MLKIPCSSDHTLPIHLRRVRGEMCDLQRFSCQVQWWFSLYKSLRVNFHTFSQSYWGSRTGKDLCHVFGQPHRWWVTIVTLLSPNSASLLWITQHPFMGVRLNFGSAQTDDKSGAGRRSIHPIGDGQQRSRPVQGEGCISKLSLI